jgi:nitrogen regulatory protein PII
MELALVVAIIRSDKLAAAEKKLHEIGVGGITVIKAKGSDTIPNGATQAFAGASRRWAQPTENGGQREWSR